MHGKLLCPFIAVLSDMFQGGIMLNDTRSTPVAVHGPKGCTLCRYRAYNPISLISDARDECDVPLQGRRAGLVFSVCS